MWFFLAASLLYPLINSGWSAPDPLPDCLLHPPASIVRIPDEKLQEQSSYYRTMHDPAIRSRIALTLRQAANPAALPVLRSLLRLEKDPLLQADLITSYRMLARELGDVSGVDGSFPGPLLQSKSAAVRREAALILIQAGTGLPEIAAMLKQNDSAFLAETVLVRLAASPLRLPAETVSALAASADPQLRNSVLKYLAHTAKEPDKEKLLADAFAKAKEEKNALLFLALADGLAANPAKKCPSLLEKLLKSDLVPAPARVAAASGLIPSDSARIKLLLSLVNDPSSSVRAAAARSLRNAPSSRERTQALGKRLRDESLPVREAAADSLAAKTEKELSDTVLAALDDRRSLGPLLTVIRATGNVDYAPQTAEILKIARKDKDAPLVCQALDTLSVLRAQSMVPLILDCVTDPKEPVRTAAAVALRVFPGSATTSALKKLLRDTSDTTAIAAMESIRLLNEASLSKDLAAAAGDVKRTPEFRAYACRALGKMTDRLTADDIRSLRKIILHPCIPVPMSPPMYDDPLPRALALYLLLEGARGGNPLCREALDQALEHLQNPSIREKENGICDGLMTEYLRQILLLRDGKELTQEQVPSVEPEYVIYGNQNTKK